MDVEAFLKRWKPSGGSESANFHSFANDLTDLLGVPRPDPATGDLKRDSYRFEHPVTFIHTGSKSHGRIDLYRAGHFVMEAKQGSEGAQPDPDQPELLPDLPPKVRQGHGVRGTRRWDDTMLRARGQADAYARAVSRDDGWPPFLLIVDVGHVIEVYADFSGQGQGYTQFPDGNRYRIRLDDLREEKVRDRLRSIWTEPHSLNPAKISAQVTREVADRLAALGRSFDAQGHSSEAVARFLMRCLFTMFAEDVELIPKGSFSDLLHKLRGHPERAAPALKSLWETMNGGGFSPVLLTDLKKFNGGLFKEADALPLSEIQLSLLIEAASKDWREVEPAIFGTLLERALSVKDRHKLGAHYTPRAYVERLVNPTIMEPLRADWVAVQGTALALAGQDRLDDARAEVRAFHRKLCEIRVLDPACGSGNFLYVALELMKRLEGEVTDLLAELGEDQAALSLAGYTVDPHQFLGIELNPWAAAVAELVLWIGYLQWHFRTHGKASPAEPVLRDFKNIENRDAVLDWESRKPRLDDQGRPVTRWDGETKILHPVTGEEVPDPHARVQVYDYAKPRPATWPEADFIVGNPPYIGGRTVRKAYADGYIDALRAAYKNVPENADLVMYWWDNAARLCRAGKVRRFGLITTNSVKQVFNRKVLGSYLNSPKTPLSLVFVVPDHPWVDASDGAAVRISMTVAQAGTRPGFLLSLTKEERVGDDADGRLVEFAVEKGQIASDLSLGVTTIGAVPLSCMNGLSSVGYQLTGQGFLVDSAKRESFVARQEDSTELIKPWLGGLGIVRDAPRLFALDTCGLSEGELKEKYPQIYQHLRDTVFPIRRENNRRVVRERWWAFEEARNTFRPALRGISRMVVTALTASHRVFVFAPATTVADSTTVMFALDDAWMFATMSSRFHLCWALRAGGTLEDRPRYNKSLCFDPFPFPDPTDAQQTRLRSLGEQLDAHRKAQQAAHPRLTLTGMYNVLEKLRAGERIEGKDREIYDQGLVGILRDLHDQIDREVAAAYGWPADLSDDEILHRLVDLNRERAAEEARGLVRWLRPDYQNPQGRAIVTKGEQGALDIGPTETTAKTPWPKSMPDQIAAVRAALHDMGEATPDQIARRFHRVQSRSVQPLLEILTALGQAHLTEAGRFAS